MKRPPYVQLSRFHGIVAVDLETDTVNNRVHLPLPSQDVAKPVLFPHTHNHELALTPDGKYLFTAGERPQADFALSLIASRGSTNGEL